ncbi:MAG: hypothetical protein ACJATT_003734 [Myxococcota bacterium]|jgi:hypothetical protein
MLGLVGGNHRGFEPGGEVEPLLSSNREERYASRGRGRHRSRRLGVESSPAPTARQPASDDIGVGAWYSTSNRADDVAAGELLDQSLGEGVPAAASTAKTNRVPAVAAR